MAKFFKGKKTNIIKDLNKFQDFQKFTSELFEGTFTRYSTEKFINLIEDFVLIQKTAIPIEFFKETLTNKLSLWDKFLRMLKFQQESGSFISTDSFKEDN